MDALQNDGRAMCCIFDNLDSDVSGEFLTCGKFDLDKLLSDEESELHGGLKRLSNVYKISPQIVKTIDWGLLEEEYSGLDEQQLQIIGMQKKTTQAQLTKISPFRKKLVTKMFGIVDSNTDKWNKYYSNIMKNVSDGYYEELLCDIENEVQKGNKISEEEIENLTFLLSDECSVPFSFAAEVGSVKRTTNNIFNITTKRELEHYDEIRQLVCNAVIENPMLDDEKIVGPIKKYLDKFMGMDKQEDRLKLALLEKFYGINMDVANDLIERFGVESTDISPKNLDEERNIMQLEAIKSICSLENIETLKKISQLPYLTMNDLNQAVLLHENIKEMYSDRIKETLTTLEEERRLPDVTYNDKSIQVYDAGTDFAYVSKFIINTATRDVWNSSSTSRDALRYHTCATYLTPENLLDNAQYQSVYIGFSKGMQNCSIDGVYDGDAHTVYEGDDISFNDARSVYRTPDSLETHTDNGVGYNELVVNTLGRDKEGKPIKLQPDFVIYIQREGVERDTDPRWHDCLKLAAEFDVPTAIIDKEAVRQSEQKKIMAMSEKISTEIGGQPIDGKEALKFYSKIMHYVKRYGDETIKDAITRVNFESIEEMANIELEKCKPKQKDFEGVTEMSYESKKGKIISDIKKVLGELVDER